MKYLKKLVCFLLMMVTISFCACSKSENQPSTPEPPPSIEDGNGLGGDEDNENSDDNNENDNETQEVYVPYTSSEIMAVGANFVSDFFNEFEADLTDEDLFDDNINDAKILFLNASEMIKTLSEFDNMPYGYCVRGKAVTLDEYEGQPNKVERFYATFSPDNADGYSSVKLRIAFSYNELDVDYDYVYYDILVQTNKANNIVSCEMSVEFSVKDGDDNSKAHYYGIELTGNIGGGKDCSNYSCYQLDRTNNEFVKIDYNNIDNLEQSECLNNEKTYLDVTNSKNLLRNSSSEQSLFVSEYVGKLNQAYNMLFRGGVMATVSNLSESLINYVNVKNKIN